MQSNNNNAKLEEMTSMVQHILGSKGEIGPGGVSAALDAIQELTAAATGSAEKLTPEAAVEDISIIMKVQKMALMDMVRSADPELAAVLYTCIGIKGEGYYQQLKGQLRTVENSQELSEAWDTLKAKQEED